MLILGSSSPRRKEILKFFNLRFIQVTSSFDESTFHNKKFSPHKFVTRCAKAKAFSIAKKHPKSTILTADTIVYFKGKIYLKPKSRDEAIKMLQELSGNCHFVYSGICIWKAKKSYTSWEKSKVCFNKLTLREINIYLNTFNFWDKAGSYAVQKGGSILINRIEGCFYNVMGLPINATKELLKKVGIDLWDFVNSG